MILGLDVGSIMISLALIDRRGEVIETRYAEHNGEPRNRLQELLADVSNGPVDAAACSSGTPEFVRTDHRYNDTVCTIHAARNLHPEVGAVISVGGERFFMAPFDADGNYRSVRGNTSCAAGTGSFLDEQARRLGLAGSAELSTRAAAATGQRPTIASRCSVFAKTDLIHAQQEGFEIEEICDGLCYGLARNLVDTLSDGVPVGEPVVFAGGVSLNTKVVEYVSQLLERRVLVDELSHSYAAVGAGLEYLASEASERTDEYQHGHPAHIDLAAIVAEERPERSYHFPPLELDPNYPAFDSYRRFERAHEGRERNPVETDLYAPLSGRIPAYLGIDIGSTSTKAVLLRPDGEVLMALYTRTAGRPLEACGALFRTVREVEAEEGVELDIIAAGTTGSGRSFAGGVFGADLILDEITAHARAAVELDPNVDTIIEIGGQDAKFTSLRNGRVTFSQMNSVCAAGTGSFVEEQAAKLEVPLSEYADRTAGAPSPLASDRCTVFMERDINYYLNKEYETSEILAAVLHSVRENYLQKVASVAAIGSRICFQGATAKNPALVASFQQKLQRPIFVSRYCHVTGAMGVALVLAEEHSGASRFRGLDVYKLDIPVRSERCELCSNHCRLRVAEVGEEVVAFGFLCGRDYNTDHYVPREGDGFDLLAARRRIFADAAPAPRRGAPNQPTEPATVGLPYALHLTADLPFWRTFFSRLGVPVVGGRPHTDVLTRGKELEQAEFCAPMANLHGQVAELLESADYVFCPMYVGLAESQGYCYYTQFAGPVLRSTVGEEHDRALLTPSLGPVGPTERLRAGNGGIPRGVADELAERLSAVSADITPARVRSAWTAAHEHVARARSELVAEFHRRRVPPEEDITVVLTGRPYTVLDPAMNKHIPRVIAEQGVQAFYHDMLPEYPGSEYESILDETAWRHARDILETARSCATTDGLYPVLVTSFKCSPDSIIIDFFTQIMNQHDKPYLILQVDEHDSSVGYETRIEAGMRAFRNHHRARRAADVRDETEARIPAGRHEEPAPLSSDIGDRTLLLPTWDPITAPLLAANLVRHGIDARVLPETPEAIRRSMRLNTGQCVPLNVIAEETLEALEIHGLKPGETALWMPRSDWSCNLAMYPHFLKQLFAREGAGEIAVFAGDFSYVDISPQATLGAYFAYLFGGLLRRIGCMIRPYEIVPGATDEAISQAVSLFEGAFLGNARRDQRLDEALSHFDAIPRAEGRRPKVAIFGDLYVRDNDVFNQDLIRTIEASGGEVVTTPYTDYTKIIASAHFRRLRHQGKYADWAMYRTLLSVIELLERRYYERFEKWVGPRISSRDDSVGDKLHAFGLDIDHAGESLDNVLKIFRLLDENPDLSLFVQASPAFCCPSLVTEAMSEKIHRITGVPVVPITYDGTGSPKNEMIVPYLRFAAGARVH